MNDPQIFEDLVLKATADATKAMARINRLMPDRAPIEQMKFHNAVLCQLVTSFVFFMACQRKVDPRMVMIQFAQQLDHHVRINADDPDVMRNVQERYGEAEDG